jgi:hypothetical protein
MMEALGSSETSVLTRSTLRNIPEVGILYSHRREYLKPYIFFLIDHLIVLSEGYKLWNSLLYKLLLDANILHM